MAEKLPYFFTLKIFAMISLKNKYVHTSGWRGYSEPINAIAGANDTGNSWDSPCPSNVAITELQGLTRKLRKAGIRYRNTTTLTSNVFCVHRYVCVAPEDRARSLEIAKEYNENTPTRLFYVVD